MPNPFSNVPGRRSKFTRKRLHLSLELLEPRLNLALDVPALSSLPGANHIIYLDFDGHVTSGTSWNSGATINSPAYSSDADTANFSASELNVIERTFRRAVEDFAPFQVNVTTVAPTVDDLRNTGGADTKWGIRVVVTKDVAFNCGCGGIAYIDSFDWNSDTPVFVFNTSEIGVAEAVSHEVGHSLGLAHDGTSSVSYYQGHGLGTDSNYWSTIMGVGYYVDVSQWDKGEYFGSNNAGASANYNKGPDDLQVITNYNGFGYKVDDHGDSPLTASALTVSGSAISASGLISTRTDLDYFRFTTAAGTITLNANSTAIGANLDLEASLYDSSGGLVTSSNPLQSLNASIVANVAAGEYFLKIDGVGAGTPTANPATGYSDYGSLGQYTISGSIGAVVGDSISIVATDATKNELNDGSTVFTFTVNRTGDVSGTSTANYSVAGTGAAAASETDFEGGVFPSGVIAFATGETSKVITINVQGDTTVEANEGFLVSLSNPSAMTAIGVGSAIGTIVNDDAAPALPTVTISATSANRSEGTGSAPTPFEFTVTRSGDLTNASSVRYAVSSSGSNRASSNDFTNGFISNVLLSFSAGETSKNIIVNVRADSKTESNESFRVTLSSAVGVSIAVASANGSIVNDDGNRAARGDEELHNLDLIAVADPLWMFVPPEFLSAEQLEVSVVTWINGIAFVGDFAHEHDHESDRDGLLETESTDAMLVATPWDFDAAAMRLSALQPTNRLMATISKLGDSDSLADGFLAVPLVDETGRLPLGFHALEFADLIRIDLLTESTSGSFEALDVAFGEAEDSWSNYLWI